MESAGKTREAFYRLRFLTSIAFGKNIMGDAMKKTNYTLMCDFYELTMLQWLFGSGAEG